MNVIQQALALHQETKTKLIVIIITAIYITGLLYWQSQNFGPVDPEITLEQLDNKDLQRTSIVNVGFHIQSFPNFSIYKNDFSVDGILWFKFPIGSESLKTVEQFSIQNALVLPSGDVIYKSEPIIKIQDDNVLISYHIQAQFKAHLTFKNFPLSDHYLSIMVQNRGVTPYELYFQSDDSNITIAQENLVYDWIPGAKKVRTGYIKAPLNEQNSEMNISYPVANFIITFQNIGIRDLVSLYFPMFVIFFIALFCLIIDVASISRLGYVASAIPILVLFRMVIDAQSPNVGYSTHLDYVYYLLVFLSLLILLFDTYVILALHDMRNYDVGKQIAAKKGLEHANNIVFYLILVLLIGLMTYSSFR